MANGSRKYTCEECGKAYSFRHNLYRHVNAAHPNQIPSSATKRYLNCPMCHFTPKSTIKLTEHLNETHSIKLQYEEKHFECESDFLQWKMSVENTSLTNFIKVRGDKTIKDGSCVTYYKCHRSGVFVSKSNGIRRLKTQGSNKINGICPANIKYIKTADKKIRIVFQQTHAGHEHDIGHLSLTNEEKQRLAMKIAARVSLDVILDEVQNSFSDTNLGRIHLLTKQDLHNIEKRYNLSSYTEKPFSCSTSLDSWVDEMKQSENCCVLFYKPEGAFLPEFEQLQPHDFLLIIMNEAQSYILKKYGNNYVCLDRTQDLNAYKYELITVMVLDDMQQGFPCASFISNRTDQTVLTLFLSLIRDKVAMLSPNVFISDLDDCFYNSWTEVMFPPKFRLYNSWHVDEAWRTNLTTIKSKEKQTEVYSLLRQLMEEPDVVTFQIIVEKVIKQLYEDAETADFALYFATTFANNSNAWANCVRLSAGLPENTHLERLHRTIKYIYLQGHNIKRLNKSLHAIMQFVRDKLIDRIISLNQGKPVGNLKELRTRHRKALAMCKEQITYDGKDWKVASALGKEVYTVQEVNLGVCACKQVCVDCKVCVHRYTCSCVDCAIKWNMCKHIHFVCQMNEQPFESDNATDLSDMDNRSSLIDYCSDKIDVVSSTVVREDKEQLVCQFNNILDMIQSQEQLEFVRKSLSCVENSFKNVDDSNDPKIYFHNRF